MNSSDSECFESADEEFDIEPQKNFKDASHTLAKPTTKADKIQINESCARQELRSEELDECQKINKRKPKTKLGTKLGTKISNPTVDIAIPKSSEETKDPAPLENETNLWEEDDWEPLSEKNHVDIEHKERKKDTGNDGNINWSSWGTWGVSSLLSTASSISSHVSQGLTTVIEGGIGAPDPTALAKQDQSTPTNQSADAMFDISNLISGVSHITKLFETTSTKVISGGLDTLETIGKKTMEVLQDGDPGLKKKRAFLKIEKDKPVLSHILREAKEKAEKENNLLEEKHFNKKANYEMLFDDHEGLVHLEALEMLSKQCNIKLETIFESKCGNELMEMQETMAQIKELCELNEDDEEDLFDFEELEVKLQTQISEMDVNVSYTKLLTTWTEAHAWINKLNLNVCNEMELHEQAIDTLAQLTALSVQQYHKMGELLLIKQHRSTVDEADALVQLTTLLINLISYVAKILTDKLSEKSSSCKNKENINNFITNVYFEAANSSSYIKNAFQLLIPVLQVGAI